MLIEELIKVTKSKKLKLILYFINLNDFVTRSIVRQEMKSNPAVLYKEIDNLAKRGILIVKNKPVKIGRNHGLINFKHYKINMQNELVRRLI